MSISFAPIAALLNNKFLRFLFKFTADKLMNNKKTVLVHSFE